MERLLANLENRCQRMLAMQIEVYEGTKRVHATIQASEGQKPTRTEDQKSGELSVREEVIVTEANKVLQLLEEDGSAVAIPQVLEQARDDMMKVQARLFKTDVAPSPRGWRKRSSPCSKRWSSASRRPSRTSRTVNSSSSNNSNSSNNRATA